MAEFMYDLDMFDDGTSAPQPVPVKKEKPKRKLHVLDDTPQIKKEKLRIAERRDFGTTFLIIVSSLLMVAIVGSFVFLGAYINNVEHQIAATQAELDIARSQNTILNIKKDSMISFDEIRKMAEEKGMIQRDRYQVTYFDLSDDDYGVVDPEE